MKITSTHTSIKRGIFAAFLAVGLTFNGWSQQVERAPITPKQQTSQEVLNPSQLPNYTLNPSGQPGLLVKPQEITATEAQWDVQFNYNLATAASAPNVAFAGIAYTGTEFWVSSWRSDTVFRLSSAGVLIARVTTLKRAGNVSLAGIRSFTFDGLNIWAGTAASKIFKINPTTMTVTDSITVAGSVAARFVVYDATINANNGGFYIGSFGSAINVISLTGALLTSVGAATHGLTGMYGAALDNLSASGPYLWVYDQGATTSGNAFVQLRLPALTQTGVIYDVEQDNFDNGAGGIAGGAFVTSGLVPGKNTLGGILQTNGGRLFGYELDFLPTNIDARLTTLSTSNGYSQVPFDQLAPFGIRGNVFNAGQQALTSVKVKTEIIDLNTFASVFADSTNLTNLASASNTAYTSGNWTVPAIGDYAYLTYLNSGAQVDEDKSNDTLADFFFSDSTFARDNGSIAGRLGFGANDGGIIGQSYTTTALAQLTSVSVAFVVPPIGQSVTAYVYTMSTQPPVIPNAQVFASNTYTFTAADTGVVIVDFKFDNTFLPPTRWFFGVDEKTGVNSISVAYSNDIFTANTAFVQFASNGAWAASEAVGFPVAYVVRPNFNYCLGLTATTAVTPDNGSANGTATATVSGGFAPYTYVWNDPLGQTTVNATGLTSGRQYTVAITDSRGCELTITSDSVRSNVGIDQELKAGVQLFELYPNPATDAVQLNLNLISADDVVVRIYDAAGRLVMNQNLGNSLQVSRSINLESLSAGAYNLQIVTSKGSAARHLIIK